NWAEEWSRLRSAWGGATPWVAVAYADWGRAEAPRPDEVLEVALAAPEVVGILVDTWDKSRPVPLDASWSSGIDMARRGGLIVALAGGLDAAAIARLRPLGPDLFAVR